jgi:hypothetical protein
MKQPQVETLAACGQSGVLGRLPPHHQRGNAGVAIYTPEQVAFIVANEVAREREACAKVCVDYANRLAGMSLHDHPPADEAAGDCADEIRARFNMQAQPITAG